MATPTVSLESSLFSGNPTLLFYNGTTGTVHAYDSVTINGVAYKLQFWFRLENGQWEQCDGGHKYKNSYIHLRFVDWKRNDSPSKSAYDKAQKFANCVIADLNAGKYNHLLIPAEIKNLENQEVDCWRKIVEAQKIIDEQKAIAGELSKKIGVLRQQVVDKA